MKKYFALLAVAAVILCAASCEKGSKTAAINEQELDIDTYIERYVEGYDKSKNYDGVTPTEENPTVTVESPENGSYIETTITYTEDIYIEIFSDTETGNINGGELTVVVNGQPEKAMETLKKYSEELLRNSDPSITDEQIQDVITQIEESAPSDLAAGFSSRTMSVNELSYSVFFSGGETFTLMVLS